MLTISKGPDELSENDQLSKVELSGSVSLIPKPHQEMSTTKCVYY